MIKKQKTGTEHGISVTGSVLLKEEEGIRSKLEQRKVFVDGKEAGNRN